VSKQYVQHISGQGEKWEVHHKGPHDYQVSGANAIHYLPKSEYRLCEPPERWVDVTEECEANNRCVLSIHHIGKVCTSGGTTYPNIYRLRKVPVYFAEPDRTKGVTIEQWAFIVEKKVSE